MKKQFAFFSVFMMLVMLTSLVFQVTPAYAAAPPTSGGTDFWLGFPQNYDNSGTMTLFITSEANASGTVSIPGLSFSQAFSVSAGSLVSVSLPASAAVSASDSVTNLGIHVTSDLPVTVYGLSQISNTTDAHLGIPTSSLGSEYRVLTYATSIASFGTQFLVIGTVNGTTVTITPSVTVGARTAGTPYTVSLDQGNTYLLQANIDLADLTGTLITADQPVGVYGGVQCVNIPSVAYGACDHIEEMLPPTDTWGKDFLTVPLAERTGGDAFRVLASQAGTTVSVNGSLVATLNSGEFYQANLTSMSYITASAPVLVAQYANSIAFDSTTGDPFMMLIPPYEQFLGAYTISTPASGFASHYVNVVAPNAVVGALTLDGAPVPAGSFTAIGASGYSGAQLSITAGTHRLVAALPFGVFVYGWNNADSYGYPGGQAYAAVASITSLDLTSDTLVSAGATVNANALVQDTNGDPVEGARVDFAVTGNNPNSGFAFTNASGNAAYSYTANNAGSDTITASVGSLNDSTNVTITASAPTITGIVPNSGPATGGTSVVITGTNLTGGTVTFGGTSATCTVDSPTQITCTSPAHAAGAVDVVVTTPDGPVTSTGGFTYNAIQTVPTNVCIGSGYMPSFTLTQSLPRMDDGFGGPYDLGFTINYFGTDFSQVYISNNGYLTFGTGSSTFTPSGMPSLPYRTIAPFYADVDTRTAGSPNSVVFDPVTVNGRPAFAVHYNMVWYFSNHSDKIDDFQVIIIDRSDRAPGDWDFEYNYGQIQWETGDASNGVGGLGGTSAAIGYADGAGPYDFQIAGSLVPGSFLDSNTTTGAVHTSLNAANCGQWLIPVTGGLPPSDPTIGSIAPTSGPTAGGTSVVITGTYLTGGAVTFGGTAASCTVDSDTQITCISPAHAAGAVDVVVTTPDGTVTSTGGFTYVSAPTITGLAPTSGPAAGGTTVVITGTNLTGGTVTFGGTAATCTVDSATQITCTSPAHAAGAVDVVVTTPGGPATSTGGFTYIPAIPAPTITGIAPNSGPATGGTTVVITGTNLTGGTVTFGGTAATCTVNSPTQITCTSPAHAAGAVDVVVTTPGGTVTSTGGFTYTCIPTLDVLIAGTPSGSYCLSSGQSIFTSYTGVNGGPVKVQGVGGMLNIASARVAYTPDGGSTWTDFSEMIGLPSNQATTTYWFPWYNNLQLDSQLRLANISASPVTVTVTIAGVAQTPIPLAVGQSTRVNYFVNNGPVKVQSVGGNIVAALRVAYKTGTTWTNFSEVLGIPANQLNTTYWFPWYNNVDLNTQIRFANVSGAATTVTVTIGGVAQTPIPLAAGQSTRVFYPVDNGPVKVQSSGGNIVASMREAYMTGTTWTSFSETMGLPVQQAQTTYWFPRYNNVNLNSQLRFANISSSPVTVTVTIGGVAQTPIPLAVGQSARVSYPLNNGPVKVQSVGGNITASIRVAYYNGTAWTSFSEMMGLPANQLTDTYWFPWYNSLQLNTEMFFAVP